MAENTTGKPSETKKRGGNARKSKGNPNQTQRREDAKVRQAIRDLRTPYEQLNRLIARGCEDCKEARRLSEQMQTPPAVPKVTKNT